MRRHECGIGRGARGRGMNAPPKLPGGAGPRPPAQGPGARSLLTAWARWVLAESAARRWKTPRWRAERRRALETVHALTK